MGAHNLALNLLILALFTLSSVILFEIFTRPPVNVRQNHEVFISFASDYQLQWQDFESNLYYSDESRARASSSASHVVKAQEIARRRRNIMPNQALSGGQHASSSPSMSPVPPLWMSKLNSKIENSKEIDVDDDDRRSRIADTRRSGISAPIQPNRMPGMINNSTSDSSNMVQRMKYAERMPPTVPRMSIPKPSKLQTDKSFNIIHANRSIISAAGKKHINHPAGPRRLGLQCTDPHCTSYLLDEDYWSFMICQQWTEKKTKISHLDINATCRFMKGVTRQPVGLVSVPGSGNTWVRGLLEIATGICTGSIYCDHPLRNEGMIGEYVKTGRVLIVKTHTSDYQWNEAILEERNEDDALYESAILLIRNPFNAFIAEWNRLNACSTYSGYAIGPKNNGHQNFRKFPKLQRLFKRGIIIKSLRSKMPLGNNSKVGMTKNNGGEYGHALPVGRKLLSIGPSNQSEDVSHTIVIDKKMFGEYKSAW